MGIFKRVEDLVSSYIEELLDNKHEPRKESRGWFDSDLEDAWNELNDFLKGGTQGTDRDAGQSGAHYGAAAQDRSSGRLKQDFAELGLPEGAPLEECKAAYRRLIKKYHPDVSDDSSTAQFLRVKASYDRIVTWYTNGKHGGF